MRLTSSLLLFPVCLGVCAPPLSRHTSMGDRSECLVFVNNIFTHRDITPELYCKALDRIGHGRCLVPFVTVVRVKATKELCIYAVSIQNCNYF